jgi:monothiol glutaredoxin
MDIMDQIKNQVESAAVILYMKGTPDFPQCGFSARAVQILEQCGTEFAYINVFEYPDIREKLKLYSNWPTFPQLFVKGELIGGSDIMMDLYQSGELTDILKSAHG